MPSPDSAVRASRSITATIEEARAATEQIAAVARRLLAIYTPDLESRLYDQPRFIELLKKLVLARGYAHVRVLLSNPARLVWDASQFVRLARRITSHIDIRPVHPGYRDNPCAFVIADHHALYYRAQASAWHGIVETDDPAVARRYLDWFDEVWIASDPGAAQRQQRQK